MSQKGNQLSETDNQIYFENYKMAAGHDSIYIMHYLSPPFQKKILVLPGFFFVLQSSDFFGAMADLGEILGSHRIPHFVTMPSFSNVMTIHYRPSKLNTSYM